MAMLDNQRVVAFMWLKQCHLDPTQFPGNGRSFFHTTYKNGDDWGMAYYYDYYDYYDDDDDVDYYYYHYYYYCFNHITWHPMTARTMSCFCPAHTQKNQNIARQLEFFRMLVRQQTGLAIPRQN